jgi:hypothetical protein
MMPTRPELSRKAISFSHMIISRTGSPSALTSEERQAGIQYWRMKAPITVPGPTRVRSILSLDCIVRLFLIFAGAAAF